jgi:hypothetical protein
MPLLLPCPPINARSDDSTSIVYFDKPGQPKTSTSLVIGVIASVCGIVAIVYIVRHVGLPWLRKYKEQRAAKRKALADQRAWYRSTRPIMRRPETPRVLNIYSRSPHIQGQQEIASPVALAFYKSLPASIDQPEKSDVASHYTMPPTVSLEPFPAFDLNYRPSIEAGLDMGLQLLEKHHTASTIGTVVSIGVAVPMNLPKSTSPTEVYNSHNEDGSDHVFVVGDHGDV